MAAQWGAGEATLTAFNVDFFSMDTLEETTGQSTGDNLEALHSCLDPSILSFLEDTPALEAKDLDEDSEATLLTALTEILDNADDENLSPFDTLPDSDLLSGQKGREHSPLRRLLCLSRSPPEKQTICSTRPLSSGKSIPKTQINAQQRSDGEEEEEGYLSLSPNGCDSYPDCESLDWDGLTLPLPIALEQEGDDGLSVSLGDLVRHMHSYCMTIHVENEKGEPVLPEGGIVLEVVDKGENEEPILAISDINVPVVPPVEKDPLEEDDTSELIVVDDDDILLNKAPAESNSTVTSSQCQDLKDEINRQKKEIRSTSPSRRKKKKKCKLPPQSEPEERRVLRSTRKKAQKSCQSAKTMPVKNENKVTKTPEVFSSRVKPKKEFHCPSKARPEKTTTHLPEIKKQVVTFQSLKQEVLQSTNKDRILPSAVSFQKLKEKATPVVPANSSAVPPVSASTPISNDPPIALEVVSPPLSNVALPPPPPPPAILEPKPKSLSLEEYRRLRQQKKPAPLEKLDTSSTKWPSLPELPKELPPIPCLLNPMPKDPRRISPQAAKEVDEVKPAWQPRGPGAPPTPEALLVPPAYMVASSCRVPPVTQSQKSLSALPQKTPEPLSTTVEKSDAPLHVTSQHLAPSVGCLKSTVKIASSVELHSPGILEKRIANEVPEKPESSECTKSSTASPVCSPPNIPDARLKGPKVPTVNVIPTSLTTEGKSVKSNNSINPMVKSMAAALLNSQKKVLTTKNPATIVRLKRAKNPTQELIESFTSEIGIEAADLTSLLEQFEETQAKVEHCVPEVIGRAAAVGNSSVELVPEKTVVERLRAADLSSTAALTPPATPPQQLWKAVPLVSKSKAVEASKISPSKVIPIEARPLPSSRARSKPVAATPVDPYLACRDHDYCLPNKSEQMCQRWNVKRQSSITIKPIKQQTETTTKTPAAGPVFPLQPTTHPVVAAETKVVPFLEHRIDEKEKSAYLETPDASPSREGIQSPKYSRKIPSERSCHRRGSSQSRSPSPSLRNADRGRSRKRPHRSPSTASSCSDSDSCSSRSQSRSSSPRKKRYRSHSSSTSSSSRSSSRSCYSLSPSPPRRRRYSYSSSRSGSWSRSRSRSPKPANWNRSRRFYSPTYRSIYPQSKKPSMEEAKRRKEKAIEERRIIYVGRIRGNMTQKELGERFSYFGEIEECTLHFRSQGDNYGFVTYYNTKDAFTAIENGSKLRKPDELPFDICFGGRRQFCQTSYADLDSNREYDPFSSKGQLHALDFDTLLKQAQQNQKR